MKLHIVGCSHHNSSVELRERLAFSSQQAVEALRSLRERFPSTEAVLISTCNRVELYAASEEDASCPSHRQLTEFLAEYHGLKAGDIHKDLFECSDEEAVRHLFTVAASLDSMVVGEAQILSQVKSAYELSKANDYTGTLTHSAFQAAMRVAKRVSSETAIQQKRVSIPSVAVADFAQGIYERFDDKHVLVIGAGEMGEETLRYLIDEGARHITIVNRSEERARALAERIEDVTISETHIRPWSDLFDLLVESDLVVSTTGATEPIVTAHDFEPLIQKRHQRPLFILDLAIPRDFDPAIAEMLGVYLYCIDDLRAACENNRRSREREWPKAQKIIDEETRAFMSELHHRQTGPTIRRLKERASQLIDAEISRLENKVPDLDDRALHEIRRAFDRLANKILHPPLESLRDDSKDGGERGLLDALRRLFQLKD